MNFEQKCYYIEKTTYSISKIISTAEDTSSLSGFLQILQEKQKNGLFL